MRSIGNYIKDARTKKKFSVGKLEGITKIKREFIVAIEKENWQALPEYPVVVGFVKSIASVLDLEVSHAIALLRRDYPPKASKGLRINPKPDVPNKFVWSPKLTFVAGVVGVFLLIVGYLGFQYLSFTSPPKLEVNKPQENEVIIENNIQVIGITDPEATLTVNNQPVIVEDDGYFVAEIEVFEGTSELVIVAKSRSGKETVIKRKIVPELQN